MEFWLFLVVLIIGILVGFYIGGLIASLAIDPAWRRLVLQREETIDALRKERDELLQRLNGSDLSLGNWSWRL